MNLDERLLDGIDKLEEVEPRSCPWTSPVPTFTYLAGAAGSGKTFLTKAWQEEEGGLLLCATTGIAAINLGGTTINSALGYFDTKSLQDSFTDGRLTAQLGRLWKSGVRRLVLDEVSMLDADQLTCMVRAVEEVNSREYVLKTRMTREEEEDWADREMDGVPHPTPPRPQMGLTLVGDFAQLSPVKAAYAFESPEWEKFAPHVHTLTEIRRQADPAFIEALRAARLGDGLKALEYFGPMLQESTDDAFEGPTILARNESVDRYNQLRMDRLTGKPVAFLSARWGKQRSEWGNPIKPKETWGIPETLRLKEGALVMILANRREATLFGGKGKFIYVNGDLGTLLSANEADHTATVRLQRTGQEVPVIYVTREVKIPCDSARRTELRKLGQEDKIDGKWEVTGAISYMPLRVAYASTVHKAQGLSLDRVQVNIRDAFFKTGGMVYVALSRARSAGGLRLVGSPAAFVERCVSDPKLKGWL